MGTAEIAATIAALALTVNVLRDLFNGGWSQSSRLTKIEATMESLQKAQTKQAELLEKVADLRTEHRLIEQKMLFLEEDIRLLRIGEGYIKNPNAIGLDREYGG